MARTRSSSDSVRWFTIIWLSTAVLVAALVCSSRAVSVAIGGEDIEYAIGPHHEWRKESYPNPRNVSVGSVKCGRDGNASWICDPNMVLSKNEADKLDSLSEEIALGTPCVCSHCKNNWNVTNKWYGYVISIAIINKMEGKYENQNCPEKREVAKEAEKWTKYLLKEWNFGDCGNDIVILYSREDNALHTELGEKAFAALPWNHVEHIHKKARAYLDSRDYYDGLEYLLVQFNKTLVTGHGVHSPPFTDLQMYGIVFAAVVVPSLIFVVVFILCITPKPLGKSRSGSSESSLSFKSFSDT